MVSNKNNNTLQFNIVWNSVKANVLKNSFHIFDMIGIYISKMY